MVSNQKPIFFPRKAKNQKRNIFWRPQPHSFGNDVFFWVFCFFWFSREKDGFLVRNHLFLEKKMVFGGLLLVKPSFSREKDGFELKKPSFSRENQKNQKKTSFSKLWGWGLQKMFFCFCFCFFLFSQEKDGFWVGNHLSLEKKMVLPGEDLQKPSFSREKDGFTRRRPPKTIFLEKKMVSNQKTIFFSRKPKKPSFGGPSPIVLERCFFLVFLVFCFSREKDGFLVGNHLFLEKKVVLSHPSKNHLFLEKRWFYQEKTSNPLRIA